MKIYDAISINERFSRSLNVERDQNESAIDGYLLTGRGLDLLKRISDGLADPRLGRAFSITGPHGGGKSSFAVFLASLTDSNSAKRRELAFKNLAEVDPVLAENFKKSLLKVDSKTEGAFSAFVTAERESVSVTIARAIHTAAVRNLGERQKLVPASFADPEASVELTAKEIIEILKQLTDERWLVLVIDEFGKNLEHFSNSQKDSDLFLLQALAEATQGESALPLILITLQHLSFDEYVQEVATTKRREWAKVQGRFQDVAYVESDAQVRKLISRAVAVKDKTLNKSIHDWTEENNLNLIKAGLGELLSSDSIAFPLHPVAQAVLPTLCTRYGQNERTLFSFIAGPEPKAVPALVKDLEWSLKQELPWVGLVEIYDYFLESATTSISSASTASRFLEIETRIRDASSIAAQDRALLKCIGVLNLISSGGALRASKVLLQFASLQYFENKSKKSFEESIKRLEKAGLVTYREFADEYRIWQGSDFDLRRAIEVAKRTLEQSDLSELLNKYAPLHPIVAARHSQTQGVLRVFARQFVNSNFTLSSDLDMSEVDGILGLLCDDSISTGIEVRKPAVALKPKEFSNLRELALDAAALSQAVESAGSENADWVALRELQERAGVALSKLQIRIDEVWSSGSELVDVVSQDKYSTRAGISAGLSDFCDVIFDKGLVVRNEMIARRVLTTQGAKARRTLLENLILNFDTERFGIEGYGPDRSIYEAIFRATGMHAKKTNTWTLTRPKDENWSVVWDEIVGAIENSDSKLKLSELYESYDRPPYGIKEGLMPVLVLAVYYSFKDDVALFEYGSLVLNLDDAVLERLLKNPQFFSIKYVGSSKGTRAAAVEALCNRFGLVMKDGSRPSFLVAMKQIFKELQALTSYSIETQSLSDKTIAVRKAFLGASELDVLFFDELPKTLGYEPITPKSKQTPDALKKYVDDLAKSIRELKDSYPLLLQFIEDQIKESFDVSGGADEIKQVLKAQIHEVEHLDLEKETETLLNSFAREGLSHAQWIENAGLLVSKGQPPKVWSDDDKARFVFDIARIGSSFRRIRSMAFEKGSSKEKAGVVSKRITITYPSGEEKQSVLSVKSEQLSSARSRVQALTAELSDSETGKAELKAILMALAEEVLGTE